MSKSTYSDVRARQLQTQSVLAPPPLNMWHREKKVPIALYDVLLKT